MCRIIPADAAQAPSWFLYAVFRHCAALGHPLPEFVCIWMHFPPLQCCVSYAAWLLVHLTVTLDAWRALLFTVQALESEAAWSRFVRNGRVQLRCEVTDCE